MPDQAKSPSPDDNDTTVQFIVDAITDLIAATRLAPIYDKEKRELIGKAAVASNYIQQMHVRPDATGTESNGQAPEGVAENDGGENDGER